MFIVLLDLPTRRIDVMRKNERVRPYPPDFVSAETLAYRLDCSVRSIQEYARAGLIPKPVTIGNLVRWNWNDVQAWIVGQGDAVIEPGMSEADEYSAAIRTAMQKAPKAANDRAS